MSFRIDASEIDAFGTKLGAAGGLIQNALQTANQQIVTQGVALAQGNAPRRDGVLAGSIQPIGGVSAAGGEFGTSVIYAWMREVGGTITGNPWLVFQIGGRWVRTRSVTQTGTHYMARSARELEPFAMMAWGRAIERVWDGV